MGCILILGMGAGFAASMMSCVGLDGPVFVKDVAVTERMEICLEPEDFYAEILEDIALPLWAAYPIESEPLEDTFHFRGLHEASVNATRPRTKIAGHMWNILTQWGRSTYVSTRRRP